MKLNRHQIAGRIVEDPEYGQIPNSGIPTIKLRVVTDDGWYDTKKQEYQKRSSYHTVKRVGKDVDQMELRKDDWVFVEGQLLTDSWDDRDNPGKKKYATFIRATVIVEIPDPWAQREASKGGGSSDSRGDSRGDFHSDRGRDAGGAKQDDRGRGSRRDSSRDPDGRDSDRGREQREDRGRQPDRGDDIPF
jgi:single-stranded DNA-binding protein